MKLKKSLKYMAVTASLIAFSSTMVLPFADVAYAAPRGGGRPAPGARAMPPRPAQAARPMPRPQQRPAQAAQPMPRSQQRPAQAARPMPRPQGNPGMRSAQRPNPRPQSPRPQSPMKQPATRGGNPGGRPTESPMKQPPTRPSNPGIQNGRPPQGKIGRPEQRPSQTMRGPSGARPRPNRGGSPAMRPMRGPGMGAPMHHAPHHHHHWHRNYFWLALPLWYVTYPSDPYYVYYAPSEILPETKPRLNKTEIYTWNSQPSVKAYHLAIVNYDLFMEADDATDQQEYLAAARANIDKALTEASDNPKFHYVAAVIAHEENNTTEAKQHLQESIDGFTKAIEKDATNRDLPMQLAAAYHTGKMIDTDNASNYAKLCEEYVAKSAAISRDYYDYDTNTMSDDEISDFYIHNFTGLVMTQKYSKAKSWGKDVFEKMDGNEKFEIAKEDYRIFKNSKKQYRDRATHHFVFDYVTQLSTDGN